ncbi:MAG TPA: DUF357 domain-containing protein [Methanomicrobiales archaeon]|nr:DUF357 domain-containing protein [Methanomicrobiales archaeon]
MKIGDYGEALAATLRDLCPAPPEGTPLHRVARDARDMAGAYLSDGRAFLAAGDLMNGLAAFTYASGWLAASLSLGLLSGEAVPPLPAFQQEEGSLTGERVREKRARYRKMLAGALEALECSPDPGSPLYPAAASILERAGALLREGDHFTGGGNEADALSSYSHGHGWLDAGVRAGLFRILHSRELFTVGPL